MNRKCLFCNKLMKNVRIHARFCCHNCCCNYNYANNVAYKEQAKARAKRFYQKHKGEPEFKEKRKKWFNKWLSKNRERWNAQMLIITKRSQAKKHKKTSA